MISQYKWKAVLLFLPLVLFALLWIRVGQRPRLVPGIGGMATAIAFSPDGKTIVCASSNILVQKWLPERKRWRSFKGLRIPMSRQFYTKLRFSADGKTLYTGGSPPNYISFGYGSAHAWDVAKLRHKFAFSREDSHAFDVSPDGHWAAIGFNDYVHLVNLHGKPAPPDKRFRIRYDFRQFLTRQLFTSGNVTCVAFSPDSKTLAIGSQRFQWQSAFWDVKTGKQLSASPATTSFSDAPSLLEWSPDGKRVAALSINPVVSGPINGMAGSTNWNNTGGKISVYNVASSRLIEATLPATKTPLPSTAFVIGGNRPAAWLPNGLAWSPDGKWLFSGGDEVRQWRAEDLMLWHSYGVTGPVAVSPDGETIATANKPSPGNPHGIWLWTIR